MYYEEKWINGRLYWRNLPDAEFVLASHDKELSRLRELVKEMRNRLREIEQFGHGNGHGRGYTCADMAEAAIAKADAILKESGNE